MRSTLSKNVSLDGMVRAFFEQSVGGSRFSRARRRWQSVAIVAGVLALLGGLAWNAAFFAFYWRNGVWQGYMYQGLWPLMVTTLSAFCFMVFPQRREDTSVRAEVAALRAAAVAGDEAQTPLSAAKPAAAAGMPAHESGMFRLACPLTDTIVLLVSMAVLISFFGLLFTLLFVVGLIGLPTANQMAPQSTPSLDIIVAVAVREVVSVAALIGSAIMVRWAVRLSRSAWLLADAEGLRPARPRAGADGHVAWAEARAFFTLDGRVYGLDTGERLLLWASPRHDRHGANARLLALIISRTGLPLRNLSPGATRIAARAQRQWRRSFHQWRVKLLIGGPVLVGLLLVPSAWISSRVQAWQYAGLVARIHAEPPLYHDALAVADGQWPTQTSFFEDSTETQYTNGDYEIVEGTDQLPQWVTTQQTYGDAEVEVTVRFMGMGSQYGGAGLLLRGGYLDENVLEFDVNPRGEWSASIVGQSPPDFFGTFSQHDDAIHTGPNATNTLLVLMRGSQYIFFVNGSYLGAYYHTPAPTGPISLYVDEPASQFSDLTIYPAIYN